MNIQERRKQVGSSVQPESNFHESSETEFLKVTINNEHFLSEEVFSSAGSREIMAIFKAGEKFTSKDRAFDFYFPININTNIYNLKDQPKSFEIAFTQYDPQASEALQYRTYYAHSGVLNLFVNTRRTEYSGTIDVTFTNNNEDFKAEGNFAFLLGA